MAQVTDDSSQKNYRRLSASLFLPAVPLYACFQGMQQILQPAQIDAIDPGSKVRNLALLTAASSITAVVGLLIGGAVSDRTRTRWGRRNPWIVAMAAASSALIWLAARDAQIPALIGIYCSLWFCLNFHQAALTAVLPDRVAAAHRGLASSAIGLATPLGILIGVNVAGRLASGPAFSTLATFLIAGSIGFALVSPESSTGVSARPEHPAASNVRGEGLFAAFRDRDFAIAFLSRALLFLAYFSVNGYILYVVKDRVPLAELPHRNAAYAVSILGTTATTAWIVVVPFAGWLADRFDRRKLIVSLASIGMAIAMIPPLVSASWSALVAFAAMDGMSFGIYLAVDLALMSLVLPNPDAQGRDIAILTIASAGSQIFAPLLAGGLIAAFGYGALFAVSATLALGGGLVVLAIRGVR
jgi:MFS family permease